MGRSANGLTRKASGGEKPAAQGSSREIDWELNLDALHINPGQVTLTPGVSSKPAMK